MQNNHLPASIPSVSGSDRKRSTPPKNAAAPANGPAAPARLNGDGARRRAGPTETILWDSELTGFGLRILPSGRKSWIVRYVERRVRKRLTLGVVGELSAEAARGKARVILAAVATDGLPRPVVTGEAPSFAEYAEAFWSDNARHWKPKTQTTNKRLIERELKPVFGGLPVDRIRRADVLRWRDSFSERQGVFNRALPVLAAMLKYAELLGHRPRGSNPCRRTPRYKRALKERYLSPGEYRRLGAVLATVEADQAIAVAVIRLLLLTGARVSEILTLRWESIQPPRLQLPDSKSGPKFIYLGANAIAILEGLERCEACPWVFPAGRGEGPLTSIFPQWAKIRRAAAIPDVRIHDLRHSYASVAINRGMSLLLIGRLLDHAQPETTARYTHLEDRSIAGAAMRVSQSLGQALGVAI
jgi:integrase